MELFEKTLDSKKIFDGRVLHIVLDEVELPDGKRSKREVVNHPGGVCVAALDEDNNLSFVKQFRYPYKEVVLELPAGKLEKGSTPLENGKRELLEETGLEVTPTFLSVRSIRLPDTPRKLSIFMPVG